MNPPTSSKENIPRGCLKLNNKIYPVYEGLNTIGRNPEAIVNIKNLNISHQHAIITVVDGDRHYISDFKSSNGTILDNIKLKPLKLYKLPNGASIKIADVFCTYKKLDDSDHVLDNFEETQNFSDTFYEASTQAILLPDLNVPIINEMPTQVIDPAMLNYSQMSTQPVDPRPLSFNEMPTQVFSYDSAINNVGDDTHDNSSSDSVDFITMKKATQSQGFVLNQSDSDTEEVSPIAPVKLNSCKNVLTSDSEGLQSTPEIVPVKLNSSKGVVSSDSEGTQSASNTERNSTVPAEEEECCSQICPVRTSIKNPIESDTDSDEYVPQKERRKSRYVISDDDETDIEDADKAETTMNDTDIIPNTQEVPQKAESSKTSQKLEQSSIDSFRLELSERIDENGEEIKDKNMSSIAEDHVYCQEPKTSKNSEDLVTADLQKKNSLSGDHIYCQSAEASQNLDLENEDGDESFTKTVENDGNLEEALTKSSAEESQAKGDEIFPQTATELVFNDQYLGVDKKNDEQIDKKDEKGAGEGSHLENIGESSKEEEPVDVFDQPTQQLALSLVDAVTQSVVDDKEIDHDSELTEELIAPTDQELAEEQQKEKSDQDLEVKNSYVEFDKNNEKELQNNSGNAKEEVKVTEDIFDQPTQSVTGDQDAKLTEELVAPSGQKSEKQKGAAESKNEDNIFAQPTQQIDFDFLGHKDNDDEIYLQPTQKLSTFDGQNKNKPEDIYIQPTQQIVPSTSKSAESRKSDDFYLLSTQELINTDDDLENKEKVSEDKQDENNLSGAKDHEFARPFELFGSVKKSVPVNDDDDDDDESICLPPTQALEYLYKEDEASTSKQPEVSDHNSNSNEVEDQLEMLFYSQSDHKFVATQQLVDVLEDKNEDIIEDSMIEDNDVSKNKFSTVDSIRKLLDDDLEEDAKKKESTLQKTETKGSESGDNQDKRTRERKQLAKENSVDQEEKKEDVNKDKRSRKQKIEKDKTNEKNVEVRVAGTRSKKQDEKVDLSKATENVIEGKNGRGKGEDLKENDMDQTNKDAGKEPESGGKGRPTRKGVRGKKGISVDKSNEDIKVNKIQDVRKYERVRKEKGEESKANVIEEPNDVEIRPTRRTAKGKKDNDTGSEISEDAEEKNIKQADITKDKRHIKQKTVEVDETIDKKEGKQSEVDTKAKPIRSSKRGKKEENKDIESSDAKSTVSATDLSEEKESDKRNRGKRKIVDEANEESDKSNENPSASVSRKRNLKIATADDETGSEISESGSNRADTPINVKGRNVKHTKNTEDVQKDKRQTKQKTVDEAVDKTEEVKPVRSSTRSMKDDDKDSESTVSAAEEKEGNKRNRGKRKIDEKPPEAAGSLTRKRNLKTTAADSGDEFEPKIPKVDSPKKTPSKGKNKTNEPETPTIRTSARTRKLKLDEDEVISVPSCSSVASEVITISSSSSVSEEPVKKSRRLSANSRAQRNEEEKGKQEVKVRGRKASVQQSPPVVPATPERSKRQLKPKVVFTMMDNPELESLIRQLGGSVVDTVDACTVLVTVSVKRSHKLLCAVGQGKPICSPQWLYACKKSFSFLDPWDYILVDEEAEKKWNFSLRESLIRGAKTKLLQNHTFQLMVNTAADVLKGAIEACGGTCVTRNLAKADSENKIIVSSSDNKSKYSKIVKQDPTIKVVEAEAIFDGTLRQEFRFDKHLLT